VIGLSCTLLLDLVRPCGTCWFRPIRSDPIRLTPTGRFDELGVGAAAARAGCAGEAALAPRHHRRRCVWVGLSLFRGMLQASFPAGLFMACRGVVVQRTPRRLPKSPRRRSWPCACLPQVRILHTPCCLSCALVWSLTVHVPCRVCCRGGRSAACRGRGRALFVAVCVLRVLGFAVLVASPLDAALFARGGTRGVAESIVAGCLCPFLSSWSVLFD
jgi:hypothetical protein